MTNEVRELLETLHQRRGYLRRTLRRLTDEEVATRSTVSTMCLGGILKHLTDTEAAWAAFIRDGAAAMDAEAGSHGDYGATFEMQPGETLAGVLGRYDEQAASTDALIAGLPDLDASHPLPVAPWFPPDTSWSARRVVLHLIAETAQHAGHADIIREAIDGAKTMG